MKEIELWAARDTDGSLYLYTNKPIKKKNAWVVQEYHIGCFLRLDEESFAEIKWTDEEPTKVKLLIDK